MVEEYLLGQMEDPMTVDTSMTKNKEMVNILGPTENTMKASGSTDSNMVKEHLQTSKAQVEKVFGIVENEFNGYKREMMD